MAEVQCFSLLFLLDERIGNLFAAVNGGDEHDERATGNNQAEGAGGFVAGVVCSIAVS